MTYSSASTPPFADIAALFDGEDAAPSDSFAAAFAETIDSVRISRAEEATTADMPDPLAMERATDLIVTTLFDVLRDTRLESIAERLAWGIVHSFHKVTDQLDGEADRAACQVKNLIRSADGSEVATSELEEAQTLCQSLDEAQGAVACLRDHAAHIFHNETGRPWAAPRGTLVSSKRTASVIAASDFLAGRRQRCIEERSPQGPVVIFSRCSPSRWSPARSTATSLRLTFVGSATPSTPIRAPGCSRLAVCRACSWDAMSQRAEQIDAHAKEHGLTGQAARRQAFYQTRKAKERIGIEALHARWASRAAGHGRTLDEVRRGTDEQRDRVSTPPGTRHRAALFGIRQAETREAVNNLGKLYRLALASHVGEVRLADIRPLLDEHEARAKLLATRAPTGDQTLTRGRTSRRTARLEQALSMHLALALGDARPIASGDRPLAALETAGLTPRRSRRWYRQLARPTASGGSMAWRARASRRSCGRSTWPLSQE